MNTLHTLAAVAFAALAAEGCAAASTTRGRFDPQYVQLLAPGAADRGQALAWFGEPADVERVADASGRCVEAWHWSNPTTETYQNLTVYFDARGAVCRHYFTGLPRPRAARVYAPGSRRLASNDR